MEMRANILSKWLGTRLLANPLLGWPRVILSASDCYPHFTGEGTQVSDSLKHLETKLGLEPVARLQSSGRSGVNLRDHTHTPVFLAGLGFQSGLPLPPVPEDAQEATSSLTLSLSFLPVKWRQWKYLTGVWGGAKIMAPVADWEPRRGRMPTDQNIYFLYLSETVLALNKWSMSISWMNEWMNDYMGFRWHTYPTEHAGIWLFSHSAHC
jgi:hypothetical protein